MTQVNFGSCSRSFRPRKRSRGRRPRLVAFLKDEGDKFASYLEGLSEPFLAEQVTMRPGVTQPAAKSRFEMLLSAKEHEMHHRGQLMTSSA